MLPDTMIPAIFGPMMYPTPRYSGTISQLTVAFGYGEVRPVT